MNQNNNKNLMHVKHYNFIFDHPAGKYTYTVTYYTYETDLHVIQYTWTVLRLRICERYNFRAMIIIHPNGRRFKGTRLTSNTAYLCAR